MIVTVIAMWVMKMPAHEVIDMVAVRDGLMPTAWPVLVVLFVLATVVAGVQVAGLAILIASRCSSTLPASWWCK